MPESDKYGTADIGISRRFAGLMRRRWWALLTAGGVALATTGVLALIPNHYRSEATLLVVQQKVPQRYVYPTSTGEITDELQAMTEEVLSRTRLLVIIDEFGLYAKEKKRLAPEEIIERMRSNIQIAPIKERPGEKQFNSFQISFTADDPSVAQAVTTRLTSLFIEENLKTRADQATNTTDFLREQLEAAKTKLAEQEQRVREFKMQHLGQLPEQQSGNLAILTGLQEQLQSVTSSLSRAHEQRVYLQSLLSGYQAMGPRAAPAPATPVERMEKEIAKLENQKQAMLGTYTPDHPAILEINGEIEAKKAELARLKSSPSVPDDSDDPQAAAVRRAEDEEANAIAQVKSQLQANQLEIANLTDSETHLKAAIEEYQNRLNATPVREQQLAGIMRDYELMKQDYADLLGKQEQSELAMSLEKHQEGQQFRLIDPPSLPTVPSSPNRLAISLAGSIGGLVLGFAMALFIDTREQFFYSEKELRNKIPTRLVVALPVLRTREEERRRKLRLAMEWLGGSALLVMIVAADFLINHHS